MLGADGIRARIEALRADKDAIHDERARAPEGDLGREQWSRVALIHAQIRELELVLAGTEPTWGHVELTQDLAVAVLSADRIAEDEGLPPGRIGPDLMPTPASHAWRRFVTRCREVRDASE